MNQPNDDREILGFSERTWADVRESLRKALSQRAYEYPVLPSRKEIIDALPCQPCHQSWKCAINGCAQRNLIPPVQMPRTPQPVSFLRWCGQPGVHSAHGRCDGVK